MTIVLGYPPVRPLSPNLSILALADSRYKVKFEEMFDFLRI